MNVLKWPLLFSFSLLGPLALGQDEISEDFSSLLEEIAPAQAIMKNRKRNVPNPKYIQSIKKKVLEEEISQSRKVKVIIPPQTIIVDIDTDLRYVLPKEVIAWARRKVDHDRYLYLVSKNGKLKFKVQQKYVRYLGKTYELDHRPSYFTPVNQSIKKPDPSRKIPAILAQPFFRYEQGAIPGFFENISQDYSTQIIGLGSSFEFELDFPLNLGAQALFRNIVLNDANRTAARFVYLGAQAKYLLSSNADRNWKLGLSFLFSPWAQLRFFENGERKTSNLNSNATELNAEVLLKKWYNLNLSIGVSSERSSLKNQQSFASTTDDGNAQRIFFQIGKQFSL